MHVTDILDAVRERASRYRGGVAVFDRLNPRQTAHIVIDLQNGFMGHGQVAEVPMARMIVPNVNQISAALRAAGGAVIYMQHTADAEAVRTWPVFFEQFCGPERRARFIETFTPGSPGHALWPELDVAVEDAVVMKRRFGAFVAGSSDLHARLQERGIDTLIISGTMSHVCCESTARDAMMMNYKVFFIKDGCATLTDAEHGATLSSMAHTFCDVRDTRSVVGLIKAVA
jgi:ureidoacrylate peracid hydrolase